MKGVSVLFCLGLWTGWGFAQYLNHRPFPTYSLENMPETEFSCRGKILSGYYADAETQCQMFHVCVKVAGVGVQDFRFLCPNGTAFDQDHQICADWEDVDCDATTLYYSSDNFDLYRIGSGFESKALKYGEDEETFTLQRAETGDARLNREHQTTSINQKKEVKPLRKKHHQKQSTNDERDIFRGSSSSNFFNNRNDGKEKDEDYDDNVNVNQDRDYEQRRKTSSGKQRRPVQNDDYDQSRTYSEAQTRRTATRTTGSVNNYAGSSYIPTTSRPTSTTLSNEQYATAVSNYRSRNGHRHRQQQYNDDNFRQTNANPPTSTYTVSTPAPFQQTQKYNTPPNRQTTLSASTQLPKKNVESLPQQSPKQATSYDDEYDVPKVKQSENYPSKTTSFSKTDNYPSNNPLYFDKKPTTPLKQAENYPTTFPPKPKPFSISNQPSTNLPTTFAPRTKAAYSQIAQQTVDYTNKHTQDTTQYSPSAAPKQPNGTSAFTQYTPTVPKITFTTPVSRSNRFDETTYDDGSYSTKYDYDDKKEEEVLKTAHSQNIAASRNELAKTTKQYNTPPNRRTTQSASTQKPNYESPRPFSVTPNTSKITDIPKSTLPETTRNTQKPAEDKKPVTATPSKKTKDVSYDYAYYDSNVSNEPEYTIDTELKKSTVAN